MRHPAFQERALLAAILDRNPGFGSYGYVLERIHSPNAAGPGPMQRPQNERRPAQRRAVTGRRDHGS